MGQEKVWKTQFSARWNNFMRGLMAHPSVFFQLVAWVKSGWIACLWEIMIDTYWLMLVSCFQSKIWTLVCYGFKSWRIASWWLLIIVCHLKILFLMEDLSPKTSHNFSCFKRLPDFKFWSKLSNISPLLGYIYYGGNFTWQGKFSTKDFL